MKWGRRRRSKKPGSSSYVSSSSSFPSLSSWSSVFKRMRMMNTKQKSAEKASNLDSSCRICGDRIGSSSIQLDAGKEMMMIKTPRLMIDEDCLRAKKSTERVPVIGMENLKLEEDDLVKKRIKDIKIQQRKSVHVSKGKSFSPRTETCKIKALEDMKKAKLKTKSGSSRRTVRVRETAGLENFAMVKFSADPEKDFRDSMMEMIVEKRICGSEELEALLACYLTLNSDDYHQLIIKVFQEVWTKLDEARFDIEFLNQQFLHDFLVSSS